MSVGRYSSNQLKAYSSQAARQNELDGRDKSDVFLEFQPRILAIARRLATKIPASAPLGIDDLAAYGAIGLLEAIERYDESRNNQFSTFADYRIRGAMFDALRSFDNMSRHRREQARDLSEAEKSLRSLLGREPTHSEIAEELDISLGEYFHLRNNTVQVVENSIDGGDDRTDDSRTLIDILEDEGCADPLSAILDEEFRTRVQEVIENLPDRQRHCILLYYGRNLNLTEISEVFGLTPSRISQILSKSRKELSLQLQRIALEYGYL
ncbi:MAG: FliA/WhiG family RNA polymerase sigma factor [Myxococcota bacterium]|nr:FliA/WhiG family RNA polymerase sigma factor [Myxococcota bacterium]